MKHLLPFLCLVMYGNLLMAQSKPEQIDRLMTHCHKNSLFNGSMLVFDNGNIVYKDAFGVANKETGEPVTVGTSFYLASVSKSFTAMAIMLLKEEKKLAYTDLLSTYFPQFPAYANTITIRNLLNHTSGLPDYFGLNAYRPGIKNTDVLAVLQKQNAPEFKPGDRYAYSNSGYVLLSMIVEKVSGMPYADFMQQRVFKPLGMKHTLVYTEKTPPIKHRAIGYNASGEKDDYAILTTGDGGMFSTVEDLYIWLQAQNSEKLVSKQTLQDAFMPAVLNNGEKSNYGFGWGLMEHDQKKYIQHGGALAGFRSHVSLGLSDGKGYVLLTNNGDALAMADIDRSMALILEGKPYTLPKIPVSSTLVNISDKDAMQQAIAGAQKLLQEKPDEYVADERRLNLLGYQYLQQGKPEMAKQIFQFNIDMHPSSANVYDSMGEVLLATGDTTAAVQHYQQSLKLNPNNQNAADVLKTLGVTVAATTEIVLPAEQLKQYTGKYELAPGFLLTITLTDAQLYVQPTGQPAAKLYAATTTRFFIKEADVQMTFNSDSSGKIVSLTLHQGGDIVAKKIE